MWTKNNIFAVSNIRHCLKIKYVYGIIKYYSKFFLTFEKIKFFHKTNNTQREVFNEFYKDYRDIKNRQTN